MRYKSLLMLFVVITTVSWIASTGFAQCSSGSQAGNNGRRLSDGFDFTNPGFTTFPPQSQPTFPPLNPFPAETPPFLPGGGVEPGDLETPLPSDENYEVVVEHPSGTGDIKVRSFSNRDEANQLVQQLSQRYWVVSSNSANQPAYREAKLAVDITDIVSEIRATGNQVSSVLPFIARIALPENISLDRLIGDGPVAPTIRPVQEIIEDALPDENTEESTVESQLSAIEGVWAAVARTSDGELRTIELKLDSGGWARLSIPDGAGQMTTIERRAVVEDGQLKLRDGDQEMLLGNLAQVKSNQFVVTRDDGQVTFLRQ